jgi:hypothetical protein
MGMEKKIEDRFEGASPAASPPSLLLREKNRRREAASPYRGWIMEQDAPRTDWDRMSQLR